MIKASNKQILVVDDDGFNLKAIESIFQFKMKLDVSKLCSFANSGKEAIDIIQNNVRENGGTSCSYKLILMDYSMPEINGP